MRKLRRVRQVDQFSFACPYRIRLWQYSKRKAEIISSCPDISAEELGMLLLRLRAKYLV